MIEISNADYTDMNVIIENLQQENKELKESLKEINRLVNADHVASIEARLLIKDILEKIDFD
jgi:hypothetical protein